MSRLPHPRTRGLQRVLQLFAALVLAAFVFHTSASAQVSSGSISGTVTDSTGAVVPHAVVVITNQGNNEERRTTANGQGFFDFAAVLPAEYTVNVSAPGFQAWEEKGVTMTQGANLTLPNITLQIGTSKQTVEVISGADVIVPTDTPATSQTLNEHMITELAIQGRDAAELIKIMPGMGMNNGLGQSEWSSLTTSSNSGPIGAFSAQGTQPNGGMTMTSDGANLLDPGNQGTQTSNINQNQIQEFTINTSAYGAEYAKGPITFQAIGKSGTSQFHGDAYLYARNGVFNSNQSQFNATGTPKPNDSYYYPGGDIGGPVIIPKVPFNKNHDKLFFYAAYEYMKQQPAGSLIERFIPTSEMMGGNFSPSYLASLGSNFLNGPYKDMGQAPCPTGCTNGLTLPGGIIPASLLDPNSAAYYKTFPQPNINPLDNPSGANYQYLQDTPVNRWELRLRGDYNISEKDKVFFSWNRQDETDLNPISIWWGTNSDLPYPSSMPAHQVSNVYSANWTHIFTPSLTNEFVFADATFINPISLTDPSAVNPSTVGFSMTGLFKNAETPQIPNQLSWTGLPGYFAPTFGQSFTGGDFGKLSQAPSISDNLTKVVGTHTLKFGFYWDFARNNQTDSNFSSPTQGAVEYENYGDNSTGNVAADFATARITGFSQESNAFVSNFYYHQYSFYANDNWKVTRRLNLTLGMRFDHMGEWYPSSGPGLAVWDPALYNNTSSAGSYSGLTWNAINKSIPISGFPSRPFFLEPRGGFAYDLFGTGKTVIRGGYGLYRYQLSYNNVSGAAYTAPLGNVSESTTWSCCIGYNSFNQFSPSLGAAGLGSSVSGVLTMNDHKTPYTESYNFTISQRTAWHSVLEVQYAGNQSHDLLSDSNLSNIDNVPLGAYFQPDPITGVVNNPFSTNFPTNDYYPLHNYTGMTLIGHNSSQNYNGAIASWQKQSGPMTFTINYTFSKVLGIRDGQTSNGGGNGSLVYPYSAGANYGVLAYDHTHIFNAAYVWNLPKPIHGNKLLSGTINGWELSGITQWQSGAPIQPNTGGDLNVGYGTITNPTNGNQTGISATNYLGTNAFTLLPVLTCDPRKGLSSGQYFNPGCFAPPAPGQVGDLVWPYIKGPAFFNSDLSLYKNFHVTERQVLQLRFEAFNFINHPLPTFNVLSNGDTALSFSNPSTGTLSQTNTNTVTNGKPQYDTGRRVIEFAAKYQF
ncbi:carboxypeptidase regulatory-like domain-containing protein [Nevskia soli]|jgi:hypothetical protein|uniref:carboxypeptidase regulatory-like domain-containing protein n=1 Tax=Nevskia soli TaxID=418856 RepID=UPI0015D93B0F|nr:carboxypeptidase regulatory-like domain-containing protein [Nevskia soli]